MVKPMKSYGIMVGLGENHRKTIGKWWLYHVIPSGKHTKNYGKIHHAING
jgi:hypothetical protein